RVPSAAELSHRLRGVLQVVYLIFNEGYSATGGDNLVRIDLCGEALRLGRLLADLLPDDAEVWGLLSLMQLHHARSDARVDATGRYVTLGDQNPGHWDADLLRTGRTSLDHAIGLRRPGPYQLQAAITALHVQGAEEGRTDWVQIAALYG